MSNHQANKRLVRDFNAAMDAAPPAECAQVLARHARGDYHFRGMHPFYEQHGAEAAAASFFAPLATSFRPLQRREDIFMAGTSVIAGDDWVCGMGHFMGLFDTPWLGIPATRRMAFLPYAEFTRVESGRVAETALFCDVLAVMRQAGVYPLPVPTGAALLNPGPRTHDGLLLAAQDESDTAKTLALVTRMCDELTGSDMHSSQAELANTWHDDMIWFGPAGIGAAYTLQRYERQHAGPFAAGLDDIVFNGHVCRFAEGNYAGWFGWPNLTMTPSGGFLGMPAFDGRVDMRVVDIYRRDGARLAENWVFIDLLYFLAQQGLDPLARLREL